MYAFIDRPVASLRNSARFLLWAARGWADAARRGRCPPHALHRGFAAVQAQDMLSDFHIAMALMMRDARVPVAFAPLPCPRIAESEAILLALWHDLSRGDAARAHATLALLVERDAVAPAVTAMSAALAALAAAGFDISDFSSHIRHQENR
ncbi:MAG: hypothetical protein CVT74_06090 [Alphaproteobacteria bacterium HGW-Alphaproteobacteria-13]|jgi:hypothetical protein|nr:MAG: hypothetical protein CVT74_06090 [Alphaproteobacteria bacterium HGW-Alphaproteobacteria-13]